MKTARFEINQAKENLAKLVEKFERELTAGKIKDYNEEATKTAFIQPLLKDVLGWDVTNRDEVSPEEKISRGRVDYGLKVEGKIKVFVEAKPPKADLNKHIEQAVRYGYNRKGVPFVLLTDFEELKLFDVTVKPDSRNPRKGLKIDLRWNNYLKEFDKIWLLSKESVIKGELDKLLLVKPKDRLPVDKAILDDLKRWRESLAKDIFKNNRETVTDANELKEITQRILDRIIFMRFCEDRNFVHRPPLKELLEERTETVGLNTMVFLKEEYKHYNLIFDSDLFRPQDWESNLAIDFKVMNEIVLDTYNPYQFDVIPLEVLGNIYEQYLGYTIRLTDHQVKYELKPDVRKAGGVYYTPEYIVDYIVKNTVGKSLQELTPAKINKLRILDPACGSGSFLIRAYEEMLNYYKQQKQKEYLNRRDSRGNEEKQKKLDLKHEEAEPRLTIEEKSQILREHIFGVDIDEQAVEVTKLSLMLKMLEGEFGTIPGRAILPMLDKNIRCGNSLISGSPLGLKDLFGEDWYKTKPFNWKEEFRKIMVEEGGFDVVIGNPPYVKEYTNREIFEPIKQTNLAKYYRGKMDIWYFFTCLAIDLLKTGSMHSFIAQNNWITSAGASILRNKILTDTKLLSFFDFNEFKVFKEAGIQTMVFILEKVKPPKSYPLDYYKVIDKNISEEKLANYLLAKKDSQFIEYFKVKISPSEQINKTISFSSTKINDILGKIKERGNYYLTSNYVAQGIVCPQEFVIESHLKEIDKSIKTGHGIFVLNPQEVSKLKLTQKEKVIIKPFYTTDQLFRYYGNPKNQFYVIYSDLNVRKNINQYPHIKEHIDKFKRIITSDFAPYGLHRARVQHFFEGEKIMSLRKTKIPTFTYIDFPCYVSQTYFVIQPNDINLKYLTGILNSKVIYFWLYYKGKKQGDQLQIDKEPLLNLPLIKTDNKKLHDDLIALVDVMLDLNKKIQTAKGSQKDQIQRQIEKTDKEIDDIVYKLYNITEVEKKIIEGN